MDSIAELDDFMTFLIEKSKNSDDSKHYMSIFLFQELFEYIIISRNGNKEIFVCDEKTSMNTIIINVDDEQSYSVVEKLCSTLLLMESEIISFFITFKSNKPEPMHLTLAIYNKKNNSLQFFDPNFITDMLEDSLNKIKSIFENNISGITIFSRSEMYKDLMEYDFILNFNYYSSKLKNLNGRCLMWSLFMFDILSYYDDINFYDIAVLVTNRLKVPLKIAYSNLYHLMQGYYLFLTEELEEIFEEKNIVFSIDRNFFFDDRNVYSDMMIRRMLDDFRYRQCKCFFL